MYTQLNEWKIDVVSVFGFRQPKYNKLLYHFGTNEIILITNESSSYVKLGNYFFQKHQITIFLFVKFKIVANLPSKFEFNSFGCKSTDFGETYSKLHAGRGFKHCTEEV